MFVVDNESERSTSWPQYSMVWCKDTKNCWLLDGTGWYLINYSQFY